MKTKLKQSVKELIQAAAVADVKLIPYAAEAKALALDYLHESLPPSVKAFMEADPSAALVWLGTPTKVYLPDPFKPVQAYLGTKAPWCNFDEIVEIRGTKQGAETLANLRALASKRRHQSRMYTAYSHSVFEKLELCEFVEDLPDFLKKYLPGAPQTPCAAQCPERHNAALFQAMIQEF